MHARKKVREYELYVCVCACDILQGHAKVTRSGHTCTRTHHTPSHSNHINQRSITHMHTLTLLRPQPRATADARPPPSGTALLARARPAAAVAALESRREERQVHHVAGGPLLSCRWLDRHRVVLRHIRIRRHARRALLWRRRARRRLSRRSVRNNSTWLAPRVVRRRWVRNVLLDARRF